MHSSLQCPDNIAGVRMMSLSKRSFADTAVTDLLVALKKLMLNKSSLEIVDDLLVGKKELMLHKNLFGNVDKSLVG